MSIQASLLWKIFIIFIGKLRENHVITTTLRESPRVLSGGLRECYRGGYESAIGGSPKVLSGGRNGREGSTSVLRQKEFSHDKALSYLNMRIVSPPPTRKDIEAAEYSGFSPLQQSTILTETIPQNVFLR